MSTKIDPKTGLPLSQTGSKAFGPVKSAMMKGLAILLPALITLAIFFWAWGVVRDYAVESIIRVIDSVTVFAPPQKLLLPAEIDHTRMKNFRDIRFEDPTEQYWSTPDGLVYRFLGAGKAVEASGEEKRVVFLRPTESYSAFHLFSAFMNQQRGYDYDSHQVLRYTVIEYVIALALTLVLVIFLGVFAKNYFGRQAVNLLDRVLQSLPVVNLVYPYAKQVVEFFFTEHKPIEFESVVACEWPREGCFQIGFVTGAGMRTLTAGTKGTPHTTVFIPMSPIPMTGFTVFVPSNQVVKIDLTVEEAFMIILSGGVLTPPKQMTTGRPEDVELQEWERRMKAARDERTRLSVRSEAREGVRGSARKRGRDARDSDTSEPK